MLLLGIRRLVRRSLDKLMINFIACQMVFIMRTLLSSQPLVLACEYRLMDSNGNTSGLLNSNEYAILDQSLFTIEAWYTRRGEGLTLPLRVHQVLGSFIEFDKRI